MAMEVPTCKKCTIRYTDETLTEIAGIDHCANCAYELAIKLIFGRK